MSRVSSTDLHNDLAKYLDEVCVSHAPLYVTRQAAGTIVIVSEDDYEGLLDTVHLLASPANAERLLRSMAELDRVSQQNLPPSSHK